MSYIPLPLDEIAISRQFGDGAITPSKIPFKYVSVVGVVYRVIKPSNKPKTDGSDDGQAKKGPTVPSIEIGNESFSIFARPYPTDTEAIRLIESLEPYVTTVHIDGVYSFYQKQGEETATPSLTINFIRVIPSKRPQNINESDADYMSVPEDYPSTYLKLWYAKMLQNRINTPISIVSSLYTDFIVPNHLDNGRIEELTNDEGEIDGEYFFYNGSIQAPVSLFTDDDIREKKVAPIVEAPMSMADLLKKKTAEKQPKIDKQEKSKTDTPIDKNSKSLLKPAPAKTTAPAKPATPVKTTAPAKKIDAPAKPATPAPAKPATPTTPTKPGSDNKALTESILTILSLKGALTIPEIAEESGFEKSAVWKEVSVMYKNKTIDSRNRDPKTLEFFVK